MLRNVKTRVMTTWERQFRGGLKLTDFDETRSLRNKMIGHECWRQRGDLVEWFHLLSSTKQVWVTICIANVHEDRLSYPSSEGIKHAVLWCLLICIWWLGFWLMKHHEGSKGVLLGNHAIWWKLACWQLNMLQWPSPFAWASLASSSAIQCSISVTTRYVLLHYDYLIRRTGPFIFLSTYLI